MSQYIRDPYSLYKFVPVQLLYQFLFHSEMCATLVTLCLMFIITVNALTPSEAVGGMNPSFGSFIPPTPVVNSDGSVDNYPRMSLQ